MNKFFVLAAASVLVSASASAQVKEIPPGLWEIKHKMDLPGMSAELAAKVANRVTTQCIKSGEKKWDELRTPNESAERKCERTDVKVSDNTMTWKMKCADGNSGEGTMTHNGKDAYKMDMKINSLRGAMSVQMEGKRIAETCEAK